MLIDELIVAFLAFVGYVTITYLSLKLVFRIIDKMIWREENDKTRSSNNGVNNSK